MTERFAPITFNFKSSKDRIVGIKDNLTKKELKDMESIIVMMNNIWNQTLRFENHNQELRDECEYWKESYLDCLEEKQYYRNQNEQMAGYIKENSELDPEELQEL